jgi:hypothetical protein
MLENAERFLEPEQLQGLWYILPRSVLWQL